MTLATSHPGKCMVSSLESRTPPDNSAGGRVILRLSKTLGNKTTPHSRRCHTRPVVRSEQPPKISPLEGPPFACPEGGNTRPALIIMAVSRRWATPNASVKFSDAAGVLERAGEACTWPRLSSSADAFPEPSPGLHFGLLSPFRGGVNLRLARVSFPVLHCLGLPCKQASCSPFPPNPIPFSTTAACYALPQGLG